MDNFALLTPLLQRFLANFTAGSGRLTPEALWLLGSLFTIELAILGAWYAYSREVDIWALLTKCGTVVVLAWFIQNWPMLTKAFVRFFIAMGLKAGGEAISETDFTDPDQIALYGLSITAVLFHHLSEYAGLDAIKNIGEIIVSGLVALLIVLFYFGMAITVFVTLLEFYATAAISVILLPWAMFTRTTWLSEKAFAHVAASGIRLLFLSFIFGTALPLMYQMGPGMDPSLTNAFKMLLGALALLFLSWHAYKISQGMVYGGPQLTTTDATRFTQQIASYTTQLGAEMSALRQAIQGGTGGSATPPPPAPIRRSA